MTKRLADLEKRQKALEAQKPPCRPSVRWTRWLPTCPTRQRSRPGRSRTTTSASRAFASTATSTWASPTHSTAPVQRHSLPARIDTLVSKNGVEGPLLRRCRQPDQHLVHRSAWQAGDRRQSLRRVQLADPVQSGLSGMNANGTGAIAQNNGLGRSATRHLAQLLRRLVEGRPDVQQRGLLRYQFADLRYLHDGPSVGADARTSSSTMTRCPVRTAWSLITFEGATGGGGDTENRIYDNSYEYRLNVGPVRLAAEVQAQQRRQQRHRQCLRRQHRLRLYGLLRWTSSAARSSTPSSCLCLVAGLARHRSTIRRSPSGNAVSSLLSGTVSDNTVFQVGARYTIGPWKFFGGYEHIKYANPNNPLAPGCFPARWLSPRRLVNNNNFPSTRT